MNSQPLRTPENRSTVTEIASWVFAQADIHQAIMRDCTACLPGNPCIRHKMPGPRDG